MVQDGRDLLDKEIMLPASSILPLILFMALRVGRDRCAGWPPSGHFPREHRSPALQSRAGEFILFGSLFSRCSAWVPASQSFGGRSPGMRP